MAWAPAEIFPRGGHRGVWGVWNNRKFLEIFIAKYSILRYLGSEKCPYQTKKNFVFEVYLIYCNAYLELKYL